MPEDGKHDTLNFCAAAPKIYLLLVPAAARGEEDLNVAPTSQTRNRVRKSTKERLASISENAATDL
jgi:hypothetical protein